MKTTTYPGIDYSRGTSNADASNGIRFGVISCHSVMGEALDEIMTHGEDLAYKTALTAHLEAARANFVPSDEDGEEFDEDEAAQDFADRYQSDGGLSDYLYEREGYKLTGCLSNDLFVLASRFYTFAQFCSPCVPGAGNLDSPFESAENQASLNGEDYAREASEAGFPRVYCLGHDWFENGIAPYAVYSVETGKLVTPAS